MQVVTFVLVHTDPYTQEFQVKTEIVLKSAVILPEKKTLIRIMLLLLHTYIKVDYIALTCDYIAFSSYSNPSTPLGPRCVQIIEKFE